MNPLSTIYGRVAHWRRDYYARRPHLRRRLARPVVSVGNLVVGGSGKTPVVAAIARLLQEAGERPAILSRGYGRRVEADGVVVVSDGEHTRAAVAESGDEPQMLARSLPGVPVLVCADRFLAGRLAERRFDATVLLLDDGFQHLPLARTVDLLLMSPDDVTERVLPAGRLREPLDAARSADAFIASDGGDAVDRVRQFADSMASGARPVFGAMPEYGRLRTAVGEQVDDVGRVVAVAGIARPERFFAALRARGFDVVREMPFGDHHWFSPADVARVARAQRDTGADAVVTTEKDLMRLPSSDWLALPLRVRIEPQTEFAPWLLDRLASARAGAA